MNTPAPRRPAAAPELSRRRLLATLAAMPAIGAVLAACGDRTRSDAGAPSGASAPGSGPGSTSGDAPTTTVGTTTDVTYDSSPDAVVVRVSYEGGFVPVDVDFVRQPAFLLAGDGRAFTPAPTTMEYPGPLIAPYTVRVLTPEGVQALLAFAASKGLLGEIPDYSSAASMQVADAPATVVTITAGGATYQHAAMALGIVPDGSGLEETPARQALWDFAQAMSALDEVVPAGSISEEGAYVPSAYRFRATPADPAATSTTVADPQASPEGSGTIVEWPADAGVSLAAHAECGVVQAAPVAQLFADANSETRFREGETVWSLIVAAVLPGDGLCAT